MGTLLVFVVLATLITSLVRGGIDLANLRYARRGGIPAEFAGMVDETKFHQAQAYLEASTRYGLVHRAITTLASVGFLLGGGLGWLDRWVTSYALSPVASALLFFLGLGVLDQVLELPFSWYHTFRLEQRFGFNRATQKTFFGDLGKGLVLGLVLGGGLGGAVVWFFLHGGPLAWVWAWGFFLFFQILLSFLAPVILLPLFNKFAPLPEGELRSAIEGFARQVDFKLQGIFTMDGSKRSSRANAFFTGFGRFRRIVLFDTLIQQHSVPELVAVLAHEVGHCKRRHIPKQMLFSFVSSLLLFWLLSVVLRSPSLTAGLGFEQHSVHAAFTVAFWLFIPFSLVSSLVSHSISQRFEFEADAYAAETTRAPRLLAAALQRLSVENLSNLNPHPWKVRLDYSHPPVIQRVRALNKL